MDGEAVRAGRKFVLNSRAIEQIIYRFVAFTKDEIGIDILDESNVHWNVPEVSDDDTVNLTADDILDAIHVATDDVPVVWRTSAEPQEGDPCPHPDCDLRLLWDPQERMLYCAMDWEHL